MQIYFLSQDKNFQVICLEFVLSHKKNDDFACVPGFYLVSLSVSVSSQGFVIIYI